MNKFMKIIGAAVAALCIVGASTAKAQLAGTNTLTGFGQNWAGINASITGTNGSASGGNLVNPTFYWGQNDGGTTAANWSNSVAPVILPPLGNGGSYTYTIGGLTAGGTYYARAAFAQPDNGTNIVAWAGPTLTIVTTNGAVQTVYSGGGITLRTITNNVQLINGNTTNHSYFAAGPN